jgi:pimeloyl-ACP methyl ester carboxylesterase
MGMYLSVTCAEDIPLITDSAVASAAPRSLLGDYRVRQQMAACDAWPRGPAPSDRTSTLLRVPALLQVGVYDPATPLEWGRRAAALLPRGRLVIVPHGGHSFAGLGIDACLSEITTSFIRMGSAETVDDTCVAGASRPAFLLQ